MASFVARLDALDFARIDDTLARVRHALDAGAQVGVDGLTPTVLLGDLGQAIDTVGRLDPDDADLRRMGRAALDNLRHLIDLPEVPEFDSLAADLAELAESIAQFATLISTAGAQGTQAIDRVLGASVGPLGLSGLTNDLVERAVKILDVAPPAELAEPLQMLTALGSRDNLAAADLASILGVLLGGLDYGRITRVSDSMTKVLEIAGSAGDSTQLDTAIDAVQTQVTQAHQLLAVGGTIPVDVPAVLEAMKRVGAALDVVGVELPRFAAGLATDVRTADNLLVELDLGAALRSLSVSLPSPVEDIPRMMVAGMRDMADQFDAMTGDALTAALAAVGERLRAALPVDELVEMLSGIDESFELLRERIGALPLRGIRDTLIDGLVAAQNRILQYDGFSFLDDVVAPVRTLETRVRELDLTSVTGAVDSAVSAINTAFDDFPVPELGEAVDAVIDPLGDIVADLTPFVTQVADQLQSFVDAVSQVDFQSAGAATLDLLHGIRTQVQEAVGGGEVPEPVRLAIGAAAVGLRRMDLSAELAKPFGKAILRIDTAALVNPLEDLWDTADAALRRATPGALIAELDPPFETLLTHVGELGLQPLIRAIDDLLDSAVRKLEALDPRRLVEPLQQEFDQLLATVRAAVDPGALFEPAHAAYRELRGLVDGIDIAGFVKAVLGGLEHTPSALTQAVGERLDTRAGAGPSLPGAAGEFRFGDPLRPIAAFVAEIRSRIARFDNAVVSQAAAELARATATLRGFVDPDTSLAAQVSDTLAARVTLIDPRSGSGHLAELNASLQTLAAAVAQAEVGVDDHVQLTGAAASLQLDVRIPADAAALTDARARAERLRTTCAAPEVEQGARLLATSMDAVIPDALTRRGRPDPVTDLDRFLDEAFAGVDVSAFADELDQIGSRIQTRIATFGDQLSRGLFRIWNDLFAGVEPLMPAAIIERIQLGLNGVTAELDVLNPAAIESEVGEVLDAAISLLAVHSPAQLAAELGAVFDAAIQRVRELDAATLLGGLDPFAELRTRLEAMRPSTVLQPLIDRAAGLTVAFDAIAGLDLGFVDAAVVDMRADFERVLAGVVAEWDALLDELGRISGSATVSVG